MLLFVSFPAFPRLSTTAHAPCALCRPLTLVHVCANLFSDAEAERKAKRSKKAPMMIDFFGELVPEAAFAEVSFMGRHRHVCAHREAEKYSQTNTHTYMSAHSRSSRMQRIH